VNKSINDYLIKIYQIQKNHNFVKTTELAEIMNYFPASITEMFKKMKSKDLIIYKPYKGIYLTKRGVNLAKVVLMKRDFITKLLTLTGMPSDLAINESHKIEPDLSEDAMDYIRIFLSRM
jgi:DtxR family Mn-dependent transcriptional regulator